MVDPIPPVAPPVPPARPILSGLLSTTFARQALLILVLLLLILGFSRCSRDFGDQKAREWLDKYNATDVKANTPITTDGVANTNTGTPVPTVVTNTNSNGTQPTPEGNIDAGTNSNTSQPAGGGGSTGTAAGTTEVQGQRNTSLPATNSPSPPNQAQQRRLDEQLGSIRARINHHGAVMAFFYKAYYMSIVMVMVAGIIAALTLFFIAQDGWSDTNPYVKTIFLVMAGAAAYYGLFPPVFQQQQNISDNKALFLAYKALENEVISYPLTLMNIKGEGKTPPQFITYVDSEMGRLGNIAIGFDYTKVNYTGAFDLNKESAPGNTNASNNNSAPRQTPRQTNNNQ
jgi:hypothetical protein